MTSIRGQYAISGTEVNRLNTPFRETIINTTFLFKIDNDRENMSIVILDSFY